MELRESEWNKSLRWKFKALSFLLHVFTREGWNDCWWNMNFGCSVLALPPRSSERRKRVSTVCTCTYYPMISWGIVFHRQQTIYILCYTNLRESADFSNLKDVCHQPCSLKTIMRREYGKPGTLEQPEQADIRSFFFKQICYIRLSEVARKLI